MKKSLLLIVAALAIGCYDTKLDYTVNPDGSGKVVVEITAQSMKMDTKTSSNALNELAKGVMEKARGVETWKDIELKELPGDKNYFKGTAYFRNLSAVKFQSYALIDSLDFSISKKGNVVIQIVQKNDDAPAEESKTGETLEQKIERQKTEYQQIKGMLAAILGSMRTEASFRLPGEVGSSSNFKTGPSGNPTLVMDGAKILEALDKLMADEAFLRKQAQSGGSIKKGPPAGEEFNEMLFGEKGPVRLQTKGKLKDQFDYATESAEAAAAYPAMIAALGLNAVSVSKQEEETAPLKAGEFSSVRIVRATMADMVDPDYQVFGTEQYYTLAFLGLLPGSVVMAEKATLESATGDNGQNLLPEDEWYRSTTYVRVSDKKNALMWDLSLSMPGENVRGLREVSGSVIAMSAAGIRTLSTKTIAFASLNSGSEEFAITTFNIENNEMTLEFKLQKDMIRKITVTDATGAEIETFWASSYGDDQTATVTLAASSGQFSERGTVTCEIYDGIERLTIPFQVKNVNLFGRPQK